MSFYELLDALSGVYDQAMEDHHLFRRVTGFQELYEFLDALHFLGALCWAECRRRGLEVTPPNHVFGRQETHDEHDERLGIEYVGSLVHLVEFTAANDPEGAHG